MKKYCLLLIVLLFLPASGWSDPVRSQGISMKMLPERLAAVEGQPWGFWVDYADYLAPEMHQPVLQTPVAFSTYLNRQRPEVRANGVWVLLFNPAAYKAEELGLIRKIKSVCRKSEVPLFIGQAADSPVRWKRQE